MQYIINNMPFEIRKGTVDIDVINEVIGEDCYNFYHINLRSKPNIVDVGGHIGSFTRLVANRYPNGNYYVYEANPDNWNLLEKNLKSISNVSLFKGALVGEIPVNAELVIKKSAANHVTGGWGIVFNKNVVKQPETVAVHKIENFYSLDTLFPVLDKIDILKLDCEGSEFSIIDSMSEKQLHKVDYIVAEIHCGAQPHSPIKYPELRAKLLKQFICPQLEARANPDSNDLFNIIACNKKLVSK